MRPPERVRARCAALPGMGERAPTATCPSPSSMPAIAVIMISVVLGVPSTSGEVFVMTREVLGDLVGGLRVLPSPLRGGVGGGGKEAWSPLWFHPTPNPSPSRGGESC